MTRLHKIEPEMTFGELKHQLYHGSRFALSELEAAKELHRRGYYKTLQQAAKVAKRKFSRAAAVYCLKYLIVSN